MVYEPIKTFFKKIVFPLQIALSALDRLKPYDIFFTSVLLCFKTGTTFPLVPQLPLTIFISIKIAMLKPFTSKISLGISYFPSSFAQYDLQERNLFIFFEKPLFNPFSIIKTSTAKVVEYLFLIDKNMVTPSPVLMSINWHKHPPLRSIGINTLSYCLSKIVINLLRTRRLGLVVL